MAKYSAGAADKVERALHEEKKGKLKSGKGGKKVTSRAQAIAIGLSEASKNGSKVPPNPKKDSKTKTAVKSPRKKNSS